MSVIILIFFILFVLLEELYCGKVLCFMYKFVLNRCKKCLLVKSGITHNCDVRASKLNFFYFSSDSHQRVSILFVIEVVDCNKLVL